MHCGEGCDLVRVRACDAVEVRTGGVQERVSGRVGGPFGAGQAANRSRLGRGVRRDLSEDPTAVLTQPLHSRTAVFALEKYDRVGVVLRPITEEPFSLFVPSSAVIELSRAGSEEPWTTA